MCCSPFEQDGGVGLGLEEDDENEDQAGDYETDPFAPSPTYKTALSNKSSHYWSKDWAHEGCIGEDWESIYTFLCCV